MKTKNKNEKSGVNLVGSQPRSNNIPGRSVEVRVHQRLEDTIISQYQTPKPRNNYVKYLKNIRENRLQLDEETTRLRATPLVTIFGSDVLQVIDSRLAEQDIPKKISRFFLDLEDVIGVNHYLNKNDHNFTIVLNKDHDDITNKIAEIDNKIYDIYPDFEYEVNYIVYENGSLAPLSLDGTFYKKE
ncbi:hypothetical protein [Paenibacillus kandeliae]|uniref:hypothetical protein n=1 Tax=Paenibacillus kandeliae TaxID=3231269 RepID=UPI003458EB61